RASGRLRVEAQFEAALAARAVTVAHHMGPDLAGGAVLGDLFEEIAVRVEEEAEAGRELVNCEPAFERPIHIFDAVAQGEGELLHGGGTSFPNVITADGNGIESGG